MIKTTDCRRGRHCFTQLHVHLVFVTKYRRGVFDEVILQDLERIFRSVCEDFECQLKECNGEDDYVHLLVEYPTKVSIAKLVNSLKGVSSRLIRQADHSSIRSKLWGGALWSSSYFAASCGGAPLAIIRRYIEQQRIPSSWRA
jgi:putative transposase